MRASKAGLACGKGVYSNASHAASSLPIGVHSKKVASSYLGNYQFVLAIFARGTSFSKKVGKVGVPTASRAQLKCR